MTHTPGPWRVKWSGQLGAHYEVHTDALPHRMVVGGVREEDAHLVAAAPEMLEALEEIASANPILVVNNPNCVRYVSAIEKAREAIRKAMGEE